MNGESPKIGSDNGIGGSKPKLESRENVCEYVSVQLGGWPREGRMKALNDARVCALLCFRRMKIPKDAQMLLMRYLRAGVLLALKLEELLKWDISLMDLVKKDVGLLDEMCRAMYVADREDGVLRLGKLLQCVVAEDEEADKAVMRSKLQVYDVIGCFRAARWYARNDQYPADGVPDVVWECWASFDPPVSAPIPRNIQWNVVLGSSVDMLKRLIALPEWDLELSLDACCVRCVPKHTELLLDRGADVNAKCHLGLTALAVASRSGSMKMVELLLKYGVNVNAKDAHGNTALSWIRQWSPKEVVQLLLEHGAR